MEADQRSFAAWLRAQRASLRVLQEDAAKEFGVSRATLSAWENGEQLPSRIEYLVKIAAWAEVDPIDVFVLCAEDSGRMTAAREAS
ncbi:MAG: helix-turn-helix transcriptional regulator [Myxococcales bacterium]|nr:helix-turn-helix transcriptional regulator [Myxococcales bacterium]